MKIKRKGLFCAMKLFNNLSNKISTVILVVTLSSLSLPSLAAAPSLEEIWALVQAQQSKIEMLEEELNSSKNRLEEAQLRLNQKSESQQSRIADTEEAIEQTVAAIETTMKTQSNSNFGGYGELHYNNLESKEEIDLHRFVLFFSHQFNEKLSFFSELEVEHSIAGEGKVGEVEVEQAFIQWDYAVNHRAKAGVFLLPIGLINETHEPDTFFGIERNNVEKNIIPATWWEGGIAFDGEITPGWSYDLAVHSGLRLDTDNTSGSKRSSIRSARQKVGKAAAESLAYTARLRFNGIPGVQWNTSLQYQSDLSQNDVDGIGIGEIDATLFETSLDYRSGGFGLRALYARWDIDNEIETLNPGSDEQVGWYIEPSYRFGKLGLFTRFGQYDLTAGSGVASNEQEQIDIGLNYWIHENVVLKLDYQIQDNEANSDNDGFNLGVGYSF
ncbi:MAG: hypothetical protein ACI9FB_000944 [Candidatus Azotimanducaceae bacterium]|jgi:predicted porin